MNIQVEYKGKVYTVRQNDVGHTSISTTWQAVIPSTVGSVRPKYSTRYATLDLSGRTARKVLELAGITL